MTRPKGKLFALLAIFMAIGIVTATGAFTSVSAERVATAQVAGDQSALVGLEPYAGPNGYSPGTGGSLSSSQGYAQLTNGELELNLGRFGQNNGLNYNASTEINQVFNITNNGGQPVSLWISRSGNDAQTVNFYNGTSYTASQNITASSAGAPSGQQMNLPSGSTVTVSVEVDTVGQGQSDLTNPLIDSITVHAEA